MNKIKTKTLQLLSAIILACTIVFSSINFALIFKPLFYYDISYLHIDDASGMKAADIKRNYSILADYLHSYNNKLLLPSFDLTFETETHFKEVRNIFILNKNLMYIFWIISAVVLIYNFRKKDPFFLKYASVILTAIPLLAIPLIFNFNKNFTIFHKAFFKNDYWLIDAVKDPIINIFPEKFFFHCMFVILFLLLISSGILYLLYRRNKNYNSKYKVR